MIIEIHELEMFLNCILQTRVFVTNDLTYLPQVDTILVLKDGKVSEQGSYQELLQNNGAFAEILTQYPKKSDEDEDKKCEYKTILCIT